jgi:hypothetical protein
MPHFECGAFNHSATSPEGAKSGQSPCGRDRLLGEVNEPDKRGADKIGPLRPEHNDFAIGCAWGRVSKAPLLGPPPREAGQSHLSLKCSRRWNRSVNEVESNGEHFCHFRCGFPDFWPYAIALPQGGTPSVRLQIDGAEEVGTAIRGDRLAVPCRQMLASEGTVSSVNACGTGKLATARATTTRSRFKP